MDEGERLNGHRASGLLHLLHPALRSAPRPDPDDLGFDLDEALNAIPALRAEIPADAYTSQLLGTEREGSGILIDDQGLILTIGYLVVEATAVSLTTLDGRTIPASVVAYDYDSGFGLVRAGEPLPVVPLERGRSAELDVGAPVIIATQGGRAQAISGNVVSKREFAGYWEYLLDEAIFTSPPHPNWGGAALLGVDGRLYGVGSLYVEEALGSQNPLPGNMFVPIDLLEPILADLMTVGRADRASRPWLGMFTTEAQGHMLVAGVAPGGPADRAGIRAGDVLVSVEGRLVAGMGEMYRLIWGAGDAGAEIKLGFMRDGDSFDLVVRSGDRYSYLKLPQFQ
jgi:S1-C subfamily serine protease